MTETLGFIREKIYSTNDQPFSADSMGVNNLGSPYYSGVTIVDTLGANTPTSLQTLNIGPGSNQGSLTGVFQNRWMPSANAIWTLGKHTLAVGGSWSHTQLNPRDRRPGVAGTTSSADFGQFVQGLVTANDDFNTTTFLQGNGDRYYRANQTGLYLQDKYQILPQPEPDGRRPLRPQRRIQREVRPPVQLRPQPLRRRHGRRSQQPQRHHHQQRLRGRQELERHHADRPAVGHWPAAGLCLVAGALQEQAGGARRHGLLL